MKRFMILILYVSMVLFSFSTIHSREAGIRELRVKRAGGSDSRLIDSSAPVPYGTAAQSDTYNIVRYDFELNDWQGWTTVDYTEQPDTFWHVTTFNGDPDPSGGLYQPIQGEYSMWCGTPAGESDYLCGWAAAPGYGNNWDQFLISEEINILHNAGISFTMAHHVEGAGYDEIFLEYEDDNGDWIAAESFGSGSPETVNYHNPAVVDKAVITDGTTRFRIHFVSDGAWSDQDGMLNTSGACIVDSICLYVDEILEDTEDFESASQGDHESGVWSAGTPAGYVALHPDYVGPSLRSGMQEGDFCTSNLGTQVEFFEGNTELSDQAEYSLLPVTPRCLNGNGTEAPCQADAIISPEIDMTRYSLNKDEVQNGEIPSGELSGLGGVILRFTALEDLPFNNLVFYTWSVRNIIDGCPQEWRDTGIWYYGPNQTNYVFSAYYISDLVVHPDSTLQLNFSVHDMCDVWGGLYGDCSDHTPCPWFDNILIQRYRTSGPQWTFRGMDLFQDTFPYQSLTTLDTCRADIANDITASDNTNRIVRGDSAVIGATSPIAGGLGTDPAYGGAAVYIHVKAFDPQDSTWIAGPTLVGADDAWMKYISDDGTWTKLRGDTARCGESGFRATAADKYMFDLNDSLFSSGYVIEYYFSAVDADGASATLPINADQGGCFEFSCLPLDEEVNVLFVDDFDGRGSWDGQVQDYWDPTFVSVMASGVPDRYDINSPTSMVGNGLESCINAEDLGLYYNTVIWDSGDLLSGTIGANGSEETNDVKLLEDWFTDIHGHNHKTNLLVMGERLMSDLTFEGAVSFQSNVLGAELDRYNYFDCTGGTQGGGILYPRLTAVSGGCMDGLETFALDGGCPVIQKFDMLSALGETSGYALSYEIGCEGETKYAAVYNDDTTANGQSARAVTCAFSLMQIRDCEDDRALVRNEFFREILNFFAEGVKSDITNDESGPEFVTRLTQNFPNPFNPGTEIKFSLKSRSRVTIRVYDVSGRLVKTLVSGVLNAGHHREFWKGVNSRGESVASGVYFCRMDAADFTESKKMILLR